MGALKFIQWLVRIPLYKYFLILIGLNSLVVFGFASLYLALTRYDKEAPHFLFPAIQQNAAYLNQLEETRDIIVREMREPLLGVVFPGYFTAGEPKTRTNLQMYWEDGYGAGTVSGVAAHKDSAREMLMSMQSDILDENMDLVEIFSEHAIIELSFGTEFDNGLLALEEVLLRVKTDIGTLLHEDKPRGHYLIYEAKIGGCKLESDVVVGVALRCLSDSGSSPQLTLDTIDLNQKVEKTFHDMQRAHRGDFDGQKFYWSTLVWMSIRAMGSGIYLDNPAPNTFTAWAALSIQMAIGWITLGFLAIPRIVYFFYRVVTNHDKD